MSLDELLEMKHTLPGQFEKKGAKYNGDVDENEFPDTRLDS
jgi:hypothetical protein